MSEQPRKPSDAAMEFVVWLKRPYPTSDEEIAQAIDIFAADRVTRALDAAKIIIDNIPLAIERAVAQERERCLWWVRAYAAYPKDNPAAKAIEEGMPKP